MRALLHPDPIKRLTADKALQHPFLASANLGVPLESMPPEVEKKRTAHPKFGQAIHTMVGEVMKEHGCRA